MNWTCEHIEERLTDYTDRLLAPAERDAFAAHLAGCRRCDALVNRVTAMTQALHALEPLEPPARLVYAILDGTVKAEPRGVSAWLRWLTPVTQSRFAMGTVTVAMLLLVLIPALGIQWADVRNLTWSDLKPANLYNALDRRANLMYARGVKFVNELRVVYEIQNMLQPVSAQPQEGPPDEPGAKREDDQPGKSNRARELEPVIPISLAALTHFGDASALAMTGLPGRNN
ncbi:MAG: anti-sigma factor family protein [Candidatus Acidiferrales bacterium]